MILSNGLFVVPSDFMNSMTLKMVPHSQFISASTSITIPATLAFSVSNTSGTCQDMPTHRTEHRFLYHSQITTIDGNGALFFLLNFNRPFMNLIRALLYIQL